MVWLNLTVYESLESAVRGGAPGHRATWFPARRSSATRRRLRRI